MIRFVKFILILILTSFLAQAQQITPYSYYQYQKLNKKLYSPHTRFHTSLKPIIGDDSLITKSLDSLLYTSENSQFKSWLARKIFSEHLIQIENEEFKVYIDFLPDFQVGRDFSNSITTSLNTRGYQVMGNVGKKFSFYTSGFENQGRFNQYLTEYINSKNIIPGMVNDKNKAEVPRNPKKDWAYATAILNYTPNKYLSFTLAHDKNFIGDGYRSMLLSDVAAAYPSFKVTATLGNVKYMAMWAQFQDPLSKPLSFGNGFRKKWGAFHYLDWNVNNGIKKTK